MTDRFVAIDFETANADLSSICQIGAVTFESSEVVDERVSLVNPEDYFDGYNIAIHGISEDMICDAPTFPDAFQTFAAHIEGQIVVSHTAFDRTALSQVSQKYSMPFVECLCVDAV